MSNFGILGIFGFDTSAFMPHGHCVLWKEEILIPMVASDVIIFLSYSAIPFGLFYFYRKRVDLSTKVKNLLVLFVLFIQLCGFSHLISAYNYWNADYYTELFIKVLTALVSLTTAIIVLKNINILLEIPSPDDYKKTNQKLKILNESLEEQVTLQTRRLEDEKNFLKAILEGIDDGMAQLTPIYNTNQEIIDFSLRPLNDHMEKQTGIKLKELEISSMMENNPEFMNDLGRFKAFKKLLLTGETLTYDPSEYTVKDKIFRVVYTRNKADNTILQFISDVTEREEHKMRDIQSSRLTALGELAGGIAHEINNPLQIIDGAARLLGRHVPEKTPEIEKTIDTIQETVRRTSRIIHNLKRLSRNEVDTILPINLTDFLNDVTEFLHQRISNHGFQLKKIYEEGHPITINANQVALSQIVINLLNNAIEELQETEKESEDFLGVIKINVIEGPQTVSIAIEDNGRGIKKKNRDLIFNPLFTSKDVGKGTGLGLSISKNLASNMGAEIALKPDGATCFLITFPKGHS